MAERISFHDQISRNKLKSVFLLLIVFFVLVGLGYFIGIILGPNYFTIIMIFAIVISIVYIWVGYYYSHSIALASVHAQEASTQEYSEYHNIVEGLCLASGLPKPKLYVMKDSHINAFASGRDPRTAVICVTTAAVEKLDKQELEGVLAHELSHVANYDIRFMTLTAVLVGMIAILSEIFLRSLWYSSLSNNRDREGKINAVFIIVGIILAILAPIVVQLVQLAISRRREYTADASAVKFVRSPTGLMRALRKIDREHAPTTEEKHHYNKATAPLFMSDPFKRKLTDLFSTHPPLEKRIALLERM
ncbi:MAG: M48 family metalloprotease [Nanoarchaeota archaeon]